MNETCEPRTEECTENKCTETECNKLPEAAKKARGPYAAFESNPLTDCQAKDIELTRVAFQGLAYRLDHEVDSPQDGRYLQMAKRALEDACMYAVKAISHA